MAEQLPLPLAPSGDDSSQTGWLWRSAAEAGGASRSVDPSLAAAAFLRAFRHMELKRPPPAFHVEFRPYAGLRSTIHLRGSSVQVRISDLMAESPPIVLEALAELLLAKLFRRRASREARECYLAYVFKESTRQRIEELRRERGYKRQRPAQGRHFDLAEIFAGLNKRFFDGQLAQPSLGWSPKRSRTVLGHYDSAHASITISRWLDSPSAPRLVVEYIMFHEMLHARYPVERDGHRRVVHSREFQRAERKFPGYQEARRHLRRICGQALENRE